MGSFIHAVEDEMLCSSLMPDKVPHFNAPIYLQNKSVIGKVDEILGPINEVYFSVKMGDGMVASSFKKGDKVYISGEKLLPIDRFLPKPKAVGGESLFALLHKPCAHCPGPTGVSTYFVPEGYLARMFTDRVWQRKEGDVAEAWADAAVAEALRDEEVVAASAVASVAAHLAAEEEDAVHQEEAASEADLEARGDEVDLVAVVVAVVVATAVHSLCVCQFSLIPAACSVPPTSALLTPGVKERLHR